MERKTRSRVILDYDGTRIVYNRTQNVENDENAEAAPFDSQGK